MREYRGKRIDNGEWIKGDLLHIGKQVFIVNQDMMPLGFFSFQKSGKHFNAVHTMFSGLVEVHPETVGQSTDLKDRNGEDLDWWEGDIFTHPGGIMVIKWRNGGLYMHGSGGFAPVGDAAHYAVLPIKIGNIHENPELLEERG